MRSRELRRRKKDKENLVYISDDEMMGAYLNVCSIAADEEYEMKELKHTIRDIVRNELSDKQRAAVIYIFYEGYTHKQVAEMMGVSKSTVDTYIGRALERIRKILADKGIM